MLGDTSNITFTIEYREQTTAQKEAAKRLFSSLITKSNNKQNNATEYIHNGGTNGRAEDTPAFGQI